MSTADTLGRTSSSTPVSKPSRKSANRAVGVDALAHTLLSLWSLLVLLPLLWVLLSSFKTSKEILADPSLIPSDADTVIYCTCPGQKTSREIIERALGLGFRRAKLLRGGLAAWKAKGFPVVPYKEVFHLDTAI